MLDDFNHWLSATALSLMLQRVAWMIPTVQTLHILALSVVLSSMTMFDLRLIGVAGRRHSIVSLSRRFMPWLWNALLAMALTGVILIVAEPDRALGNPMFLAKMIMLCIAVGITWQFQKTLERDLARGSLDLAPAHRAAAKLTGFASIFLWLGIAIAGRWIAYTG